MMFLGTSSELCTSAHISWHISRVEQELTSNLASGPSDVPQCVLWKKRGKMGGEHLQNLMSEANVRPQKMVIYRENLPFGSHVEDDIHGMMCFVGRVQ